MLQKKTLTPLKSASGRSRGVGSHGQESPSASWSILDGVGMIRIGSKMQTIEAQSRRGTRFAQKLAGGCSSQMLAKNMATLYLCPANLS